MIKKSWKKTGVPLPLFLMKKENAEKQKSSSFFFHLFAILMLKRRDCLCGKI